MGLSASQGRLLLLTARQNDLEYQAQQISQQRLALSAKLNDVSEEYETATSNRQMLITLASSSDSSSSVSLNLTYARLVSGTASMGSCLAQVDGVNTSDYSNSTCYRLTDGNGAIVVSDVSEIPDGDISQISTNKYTCTYVTGYYTDTDEETGEEETYPLYTTDTYIVDTALKNTSGINYLQDCLRNGKYLIEKYDSSSSDSDEAWSEVSWDATSNITDQYYEDDDAAAKAKYDRLSNQIQTQDKKLQLELDNIETQRDAVKTERESVQTVITDNIEKTFDTFG